MPSLKLFRFRALSGIALVAVLSALHATPVRAAAPDSSSALVGIAHAAIRVSDLPRARDFYEKLGFKVAFSMSKNGQPTEVFMKVNDLQFIELYPQHEPAQPIGFLHVCFQAADIRALDDTYRSRGLAPKPVQRAGAGNLLFTMVGPEDQNMEYTQYMPGSMHWDDRGKDLGADRISERIVGVAIPMQDTASADAFYTAKLGFTPALRSLEPGATAVTLPGESQQQIEFVPKGPGLTFHLLFATTNERATRQRLQALGLYVHSEHKDEWIADPDGNRLVFVPAAVDRSEQK